MFLCAITKTVTAPRVPMKRVVVETRPVAYTNIIGYEVTGAPIIKVSHGWEIVREIGVSPEGAKQLESSHADPA